ncbi:phage capsid protein [Bifidobacterium sp. GSD1FS]|uniref:Phage capsid protein n=1 Tax=Bifidobacterium canis TaxID=2610880 RepID=A0A7K1J7R8_9BIFI|nr:phage capsid protein [Bifidobacterium canis]
MAENFASAIKRSDLGDALIPSERSTEIIQTLPQQSVIATRARRVTMSKLKKTQPVLASLPDAYWVKEGGLKQTTKTDWEDVSITAEELAVLVPIPDSVVEDADIDLWAAIKPLIAEAFGKKIDQAALFGVDKPTTWGTDVFAGATAAKNIVAEGTGTDYAADVALLGQKLAEQGFAANGFAAKAGLNWQRIIPASAGQTQRVIAVFLVITDHPRECGANMCYHNSYDSTCGSSPRVRGKRHARPVHQTTRRIIPASAGQT